MSHPSIPGMGPRGHGHWYDAYSQFLSTAFANTPAPDPSVDPLGVADPRIPHPGADQCAVCATPRGARDREWNSAGTWWCPGCKQAYTAYLDDHPIAAHPNGLATQMPVYMYAPAYWPGLGFDPADLDAYRPGAAGQIPNPPAP